MDSLPPSALARRAAIPPGSGPAAPSVQPFEDAEEAWFWTMSALEARREGTHGSRTRIRIPRPCEPDDVVRCLDRLYRRRRVDLEHARILRRWGERGHPPSSASPSQHADWRVWREAMDRLEWPLRVKGIVA